MTLKLPPSEDNFSSVKFRCLLGIYLIVYLYIYLEISPKLIESSMLTFIRIEAFFVFLPNPLA